MLDLTPEQDRARFWTRVDKNGPLMLGMNTRCWVWTGARNWRGYGLGSVMSRVSGRPRSIQKIASRISWEIANGPIPLKLHVLHDCDNPPCVNPDHLYVGTPKNNARDRWTRKNARFGNPDLQMYKRKLSPASGSGQRRGEHHHGAHLTERQVREIRARAAAGESLAGIAKKYPITLPTVYQIVQRRTWRHVP
jgi:HNH endonuclease